MKRKISLIILVSFLILTSAFISISSQSDYEEEDYSSPFYYEKILSRSILEWHVSDPAADSKYLFHVEFSPNHKFLKYKPNKEITVDEGYWFITNSYLYDETYKGDDTSYKLQNILVLVSNTYENHEYDNLATDDMPELKGLNAKTEFYKIDIGTAGFYLDKIAELINNDYSNNVNEYVSLIHTPQ